jgi:hypothetical protein
MFLVQALIADTLIGLTFSTHDQSGVIWFRPAFEWT